MSIASEIVDGEICELCLLSFPVPLGYPAKCAECGGYEEAGLIRRSNERRGQEEAGGD